MTHAEELRAWAKGSYTYEAAVELLLRGFGGRFAAPGQPWVKKDSLNGQPWIDFEVIPEEAGALSGGEQKFLGFAASLSGEVPVVLGHVLPGLDRDNVRLVLAAAAHAAGSHEHSGTRDNGDGTASLTRLGGLYSWPDA